VPASRECSELGAFSSSGRADGFRDRSASKDRVALRVHVFRRGGQEAP
jgi:hypothetical protein